MFKLQRLLLPVSKQSYYWGPAPGAPVDRRPCLIVYDLRQDELKLKHGSQLLYGCEIWTLGSSDYHKMNVICNKAFRKIYLWCWRDSVSCLLYYCKVLPMSHITDQRKLLFLKKIRTCDNSMSIVRSLSILSTYKYGKIMSKYSIHNQGSGAAQLKSSGGILLIQCFECIPLSIFVCYGM